MRATCNKKEIKLLEFAVPLEIIWQQNCRHITGLKKKEKSGRITQK